MYNNTNHVFRYLLYYASKNNKSLILEARSPFDLEWKFSFIEKGFEQKNQCILNENNIKEFSYSINFNNYSYKVSLDGLLPEKKVDFCIYFSKDFPEIFKQLSLIKQISLEGIVKNLWKNKSQQSNTIEFLNDISPLVFYRSTKNEKIGFVKEIKENTLNLEFYSFLSNYFEKQSDIFKDEPFKLIFSELMRVAASSHPEITIPVINKYPFLKEYFEQSQSSSENDIVDFKRIKISFFKLHVALMNNGLGVTDSVSLLDAVLSEVGQNSKLKELGLIEFIVKNEDTDKKSIFLGFDGNAKVSYLQIEDLITDCVLECAKKKDKNLYPTVVSTLVMNLWLPEKENEVVKKIKI